MSQNQRAIPRFILIDHSIIDIGGHHYEYALHVLRAAERAGYEPVLATNRRFQGDPTIPGRVVPAYRYGLWFRIAEPSWYRRTLAWAGSVRVVAFRLAVRAVFSPVGVLWTARRDLRTYFATRTLEPDVRLAVIVVAVGYVANIVRLALRLVVSVIPLSGYLARVRAHAVALAKGIAAPVRMLLPPNGVGLRWWYERRRMRQFARDTRRVFEARPLAEGDHVFLPTLSVVELAGLLDYLSTDARSRRAVWHILFRRNLYAGRDAEYAAEDEGLRAVRNAFLRAHRSMATHRLRFLTDTDRLTAQYDRLGFVRFRTVPIPHTSAPVVAPRPPDQPLRVVYLGDARTEKGYQHLPRLIRDLWADRAMRRSVSFIIQSYFNSPEGEPAAVVARTELELMPTERVVLLREPLSSEAYTRLLASADINLLLYDRNAYYARSSGILIESLAAGVPVVVPAGTWMADQLAGEIIKYHERLCRSLPIVVRPGSDAVRWSSEAAQTVRSGPDGVLSVAGGRRAFCWLDVPASATLVRVSGRLQSPGVYPAVFIEGVDALGSKQGSQRAIATASEGREFSVMFRLRSDAVRLRVALGDAFGEAGVVAQDVQVQFLAAARDAVPLGAVGAAYVGVDDISGAVREVIRHYPHYRQTAREHAGTVYAWHNASRLIDVLQDVSVERARKGGVGEIVAVHEAAARADVAAKP